MEIDVKVALALYKNKLATVEEESILQQAKVIYYAKALEELAKEHEGSRKRVTELENKIEEMNLYIQSLEVDHEEVVEVEIEE